MSDSAQQLLAELADDNEAVAITDETGRLLVASEAFTRHMGIDDVAGNGGYLRHLLNQHGYSDIAATIQSPGGFVLPQSAGNGLLLTFEPHASFRVVRINPVNVPRPDPEKISYAHLQSLLRYAPTSIMVRDREGIIIAVSKQVSEVFDVPHDEMPGKHVSEVFPENITKATLQEDAEIMRTGQTIQLDADLPHPDGTVHNHIISKFPLVDHHGHIYAICTFATDITQHIRTEQDLRESEARFRTMMQYAPEAILIYDPETFEVIDANQNACELVGKEHHELLGLSAGQLSPEVQHDGVTSAERIQQIVAQVLSGEAPIFEYTLQHVSGKLIPCEARLVTLPFRDKMMVRASIVDISDRKSAEKRLAFMAHHDALTQLPNRTLLNDRMHKAFQRAKRNEQKVGIMLVDLDRFKNINDTLGHNVGDELLKTLASRLSNGLRSSDTVARLGGDEFVVLMEDLDSRNDSTLIADKLFDRVSQPAKCLGNELNITLSGGIALYPCDGDTPDIIMKNADVAMYDAKKRGRNRYSVYNAGMNTNARRILELEYRMRVGMEREDFLLYYQPQVDMSTGKLIGAEALIRWPSDNGMVSPGDFIPVAEDSGLIVPLGSWVLEEAVRQIARWRNKGVVVPKVAVNISAKQFLQDNFETGVLNLLRQYNVPPELLELELTERVMMDNVDSVRSTMESLADSGIQMSIDDFGTGYSSLAYLKTFPIHKLKIDQGFVRDVLTDPNDAAIVDAIVALTRSMQLEVIAEGVETSDQSRFLLDHGCRQAQGYFYAKPMPADDFEALVAEFAAKS